MNGPLTAHALVEILTRSVEHASTHEIENRSVDGEVQRSGRFLLGSLARAAGVAIRHPLPRAAAVRLERHDSEHRDENHPVVTEGRGGRVVGRTEISRMA